MATPNLKKVFLTAMIASLTLAALTGIGVFLFGNFGELEMRILLTTLFFGLFSLTSLCCAALLEESKTSPVGIFGILCSAAALLLALNITWLTWQTTNESLSKSAIIAGILAMSLAHASLLLLVPAKHRIAATVRNATLVAITAVTCMLVYLVLMLGDVNQEFFFRLLGVFAILDVLGTIVTPVLLKLLHKKKVATKKKK